MAQPLIAIGRYLDCAIHTELVVELELVLIEKKQSCGFQRNSVICQKIRGPKCSRRLALCQGQRSCRAKNSKTQSKDPELRFANIRQSSLTIFNVRTKYVRI